MTTYTDPHEDQALLSRYIDGDLQTEQSKALEEHIKQCITCQNEVKMLRQTIDWIGQLRQMKAPEDFPQQVKTRIRKQRGKRRRARLEQPNFVTAWLPTLLVAAVVALSIALFFLLGQS